MSESKMSFWLNFFLNAGIPPSDSAQYATTFVDNRLDKSMLLELNKQYLNDMGVTRLGDVISILKHAKEVYKQTCEESILGLKREIDNRAAVPLVGPYKISRKRPSAMARIVSHCLNDPQATASPPPSQPSKPLGIGNATSVFERLGRADASGSPDTLESSVGESSVFLRLGNRKRTVEAISMDDNPGDVTSEPLQYEGVLVSSGKKRKPPPPPPVQAATPDNATITAGILGDNANIPKRLKDRLGKVVSPADTTVNPSGDSQDNLIRSSKSISQRLGKITRISVASEVSSSSDQQLMGKRPILARLGKQTKIV